MHRQHGVVKNAFITGIGNNTVSILAAITIFGVVFAVLGAEMTKAEVLGVMQDSGPASTGLTFIWMPQLFAKMGGSGTVLAILFFLGLSFAAFSSLISMIQLATRVFIDMGLQRKHAVMSVCSVGFLLGIPSAINLDFFSNQDFVWGVALMIAGGFVAFAVIKQGVTQFRLEEVDGLEGDWNAGPGWGIIIKYLVPLQAVALLVWWMYLSATAYAPDTWYDPTDPFSVMTCLVQWGVALAAFLGLNRWLARRTLATVA